MPYRQIQTSLQSEDWFLALSFRGRLLFFTLVTSDLTTVSGFCSASFTRLLHDTGLKKDDLRLAISELCDKKKLVYLDNLDLFFLPRFQKWQGSGPKFQIAVNNSLNNLPPEAKNTYTLYNTLSDRVSNTLPDRDNAYGAGNLQPLTVNSNSNRKHTTVTEEEPPFPPPPARVSSASSSERLNGDLATLVTCYEQNILGPMSPVIADELKLILSEYGLLMVTESIKQSVIQGKRSLAYVKRTCQLCKASGTMPGDGKRETKHGEIRQSVTSTTDIVQQGIDSERREAAKAAARAAGRRPKPGSGLPDV